jgi:hypothetical protein
MNSPRLQHEIACYDKHRATFVEDHRDEYVLIKGQTIVGFFTEEVAAIHAGYDKFGNEAFLVRLCAESTAPILFTSLFVGSPASTA